MAGGVWALCYAGVMSVGNKKATVSIARMAKIMRMLRSGRHDRVHIATKTRAAQASAATSDPM